MPSNQIILITGSSTGFGRLFAETLARHGHTVFASMRDPQGKNAKNAAELLALARRESLAMHIIALDVTRDASVESAVGSVIAEAGRIDVAINNAGYGLMGFGEATTTEEAQRIMDTNFMGCQRVNRAVLPHMRRQRSGLLLYISSGAGRLILPAFGFYCASKFAMEALAEAYSYELAAQGIESVIVEPGAYQTPVFTNMVVASDTERTATYGSANQIAAKISNSLASAAGDPQDLADAVARIIETPVGEKKLRYRVSPNDLGIDVINDLCATVQSRALKAFDLVTETTFTRQKATASD